MTPATATANDTVISTESSSLDGIRLRNRSSTGFDVIIGGATTSAQTIDSVTAIGTRTIIGFVVDDGTIAGYSTASGASSTADITGVGTISHGAMSIGARSDNDGNVLEADIDAVFGFERVLEVTQIATIETFFRV